MYTGSPAATVKLLLEHHANPALRNQRREQALDIAGNRDHAEVVSLLKDSARGFW
ncbi:MAG: hypothetical protein ACE5FQ_12940 [Thiogranum sp.]